jgi:hypothetical protein
VTAAVTPTASPYWLLINGAWVHLEGVTPGVEIARNRATSELITVDGYRYWQQAPRGPRDWTLNYQWATPVAAAVLEAAAEQGGELWLLDQTKSIGNMLPPDACFGYDPAAAVIDCGGVPLRALDLTSAHVVATKVRAGVTYYVHAWSASGSAATLGTVAYPGGSAALTTADRFPAEYEADFPLEEVLVSFTPTADGDATITLTAGGPATSGLMLTEGLEPDRFVHGSGSPCKVAVADPSQTVNRAWPDRLPWSDYAVVVKEVA